MKLLPFLCHLVLAPGAMAQAPPELTKLAEDFWSWRAAESPFNSDDVPRIDRPQGWAADWSPLAVARYKTDLAAFEDRWQKLSIDRKTASRTAYVDYRLMGSAIARVRWELDTTRGWQTNPFFYIDQTVGAVHNALVTPPPFDAARGKEIIRRFSAIPGIVQDAESNLTDPSKEMAQAALDELKDMHPRLGKVAHEMKPYLDKHSAALIETAAEMAGDALDGYAAWLRERLPKMSQQKGVGRDAYMFFLKKVALIPYGPEEMVAKARQEWERSLAFEAFERARNAKLAPMPLAKDQAQQMAWEQEYEAQIRRLYDRLGVLSFPDWAQHYRSLSIPPYLEPLASIGSNDDFTGPARLKENAVSYIFPPSEHMSYFGASMARDPRPIILHEGVPGHYFQLALSWAHEDPIRRHYYDSGVNEGIGFYNEELGLQLGVFDDSPHSREIIYNFMRLRALRVEVDVKLALGEFTIEQGANYLEKLVPMDHASALGDAMFYEVTPGLGIDYQTGKLQIMKFLADVRLKEGKDFDLRRFHDSLWKNGNVPVALQRYEYLGVTDELEKLDQ